MSDHWQMPDEEQWSYTGKGLAVTASGQVFKGAAEHDPSTSMAYMACAQQYHAQYRAYSGDDLGWIPPQLPR